MGELALAEQATEAVDGAAEQAARDVEEVEQQFVDNDQDHDTGDDLVGGIQVTYQYVIQCTYTNYLVQSLHLILSCSYSKAYVDMRYSVKGTRSTGLIRVIFLRLS